MNAQPEANGRLQIWWRPLPSDQSELKGEFLRSVDPIRRSLLSGLGYVGGVIIVLYAIANVWFHYESPWLWLIILLDVGIGAAFLGLPLLLRWYPTVPTQYIFFPLYFFVFIATGVISYVIDDLVGYLALVVLTNGVIPIVPWRPLITRSIIFCSSFMYLLFNLVWQSPYEYLNVVQPFLLLTVLGSAAIAVIFHAVLLHQRWDGFLTARNVVALNEQLQKHTAVLETLNDQLIQQNDELDAFAHTVAHDLKTPLGVIYGYAGLLHEEIADASFAPDTAVEPSELLDVTSKITHSSKTAANIVDELLLLARIRREEIQLEPVSMGEVVEVALMRLDMLVKQTEADIKRPAADDWPTAVGYAPWLVEVWANYLSNALKYGGRPCHVQLGADRLPESNEARFWIEDNGPGLTGEQTKQLFREFSRLHTKMEGHGLGLTIVARIIHKLGGRVGVESEHGRGSRFYFVLPISSEK